MITADEIKEFWHDFCERKGVACVTGLIGAVRDEGMAPVRLEAVS